LIHVIGFEGLWPDDAIVAWGAAAVQTTDRLKNSLSGLDMPWLHSSSVQSENISFVEMPTIDLDDDYVDSPLVVLAVRKREETFRFFLPDTGRLQCLGSRYNKDGRFYVFENRVAFDTYAADASLGVVAHILRENSISTQQASTLLRQCLILSPANPFVHAVRVYFSGDSRVRTALLARACLRTNAEKKTFDEMLEALGDETSNGSRCWLKYEDGIARGGGLDAVDAAKQFTALAALDKRLRPLLLDRLPFFDAESEIPSIRIYEMRPGSANIGFEVSLPDRPLIERVARYFELQLLQEILRGAVPPELSDDPKFQDDLDKLVNPGDETRVLQIGFGRDDAEPVVFQPFSSEEAKPEKRFVVFGIIQGVVGEVKRAELKLFPGIRELVSITDTGFDGVPVGSHVFQNRNDFLFRPASFDVHRFIDANSRYRLFLQRIDVLEREDHAKVTAFPSSVVRGAFVLPHQPIDVAWHSGGVVVSGVLLTDYPSANHSSSDRLVEALSVWAKDKELELASTGQTTWIRAPRSPRPTALMRLLVSLDALNGRNTLSNLINEANRRFGTVLRRNNSLREINRSREYMAIGDDDDVVQLTNQGKLLVSIFKAAGGSIGDDPLVV
jgi:hypothetical protein